MQIESATISVKGKRVSVPSVNIDGSTIIVTGKWLKIAMVQDEEWLQNEPIKDPESFTANLRQLPLKADLFTFSQRLGETKSHFNDLHFEPDNAAAIPITTFDQWWESLPQVTRKNVRRAGRRGVTVKVAPFNDELVQGITQLYNETPIRQGRRFWHYGKDFDTVKGDNSSYLDRSDFVVAYHNNEIIGFIKLVYVGESRAHDADPLDEQTLRQTSAERVNRQGSRSRSSKGMFASRLRQVRLWQQSQQPGNGI